MMLSTEVNVNIILKALSKRKKITRLQITTQEMADYLFTIDEMNSLDRHTTQFGSRGESIEDWEIASIFSNFIYPSEVTVTGARMETDLLVRPILEGHIPAEIEVTDYNDRNLKKVKVTPKVMTRTNFIDVGEVITGAFRDIIDLEPVIRKPLPLAEAINLQVVNDKVTAEVITRLPFKLTTQFKRKQFYSYDADLGLYDLLDATIDIKLG